MADEPESHHRGSGSERSAGRATSRGQVSRIDRGYYGRRSPLQRARGWLVLAGLAAGVAWVAWGAIDQPRHHAPGPVAAVHARWERECSACHEPFELIKDGKFYSSPTSHPGADARCEECHADVAARPHHPLQNIDEVGSCGSCHQDHRGRDADIVRVADRTCTHCHADIGAHRISGGEGVEPVPATQAVSAFAVGRHPPFRSLDKDPGRLKFSHGRHMLPGLSFASANAEGPPRGTQWTYAMLPAADRSRYQAAGDSDDTPVQLDCTSCHEFGATGSDDLRAVSGLLTGAAPGAYALPIEFDRHCAACHQLPYTGLPADPPGATDAAAAGGAPAAVLPHGLSAGALRRFLESAALGDALRADPALLDQPPAVPPLPSIRDADPSTTAIRGLVDERLARGRTFARATCEKCHATADVTLPAATSLLPAMAEHGADDTGWFAVEPALVPAVWLTKARFNHQPHRNLPRPADRHECSECHAAAFPDDATRAAGIAGQVLDNSKVMIAGLESCTTCHAPAGRDSEGRSVGGVRHDCVECHGYHGLGPHGAAAAPAHPER
ncbi:MAG: hypothetical protein EBR86_01200 [Planctomycetia bacterium]|nr:hypothetical protein [Planctomycetia bacterium]